MAYTNKLTDQEHYVTVVFTYLYGVYKLAAH